ncbi:hypothetical protein C922_01174 [Plasmodium inui San Antonio 1]|uniref:Uncharacterized protein n=1 Tax=Plasmodium inui San Antonio 1 TaxID=1237626 RepID=W7ARQ5_9APIC|nr:hypothetical protein C922_01174 [Plasmodium inui San Antonio 1]EUD68156.1 hypothetical protein C922_01174 [Plasmodium inui San Antonio 1]
MRPPLGVFFCFLFLSLHSRGDASKVVNDVENGQNGKGGNGSDGDDGIEKRHCDNVSKLNLRGDVSAEEDGADNDDAHDGHGDSKRSPAYALENSQHSDSLEELLQAELKQGDLSEEAPETTKAAETAEPRTLELTHMALPQEDDDELAAPLEDGTSNQIEECKNSLHVESITPSGSQPSDAEGEEERQEEKLVVHDEDGGAGYEGEDYDGADYAKATYAMANYADVEPDVAPQTDDEMTHTSIDASPSNAQPTEVGVEDFADMTKNIQSAQDSLKELINIIDNDEEASGGVGDIMKDIIYLLLQV